MRNGVVETSKAGVAVMVELDRMGEVSSDVTDRDLGCAHEMQEHQ